jgi:hypothetical protein
MSLMVLGWGGWGAGPNMWRTFRQEVGGAGGAATRPPSWNADPCHPTAKEISLSLSSVEDSGCLSRIKIFSHPRSRIQQQQRKRGGKINKLSYLSYNYKFHNIENYLILGTGAEIDSSLRTKNLFLLKIFLLSS